MSEPSRNPTVELLSTAALEHDKPVQFEVDEHSLGCGIRKMVALTILSVLVIGRELVCAFQLLSKRGRGSLFPVFLATYLPTIDRKTADRWRAAYECFRELIPLDDDQTECPEIEKIRLTALYRLSKTDVTNSQRKAALALAGQGVIVTEKIAVSLVKGDNAARHSPQRRKRTIQIPNGVIEIRVTDDDVLAALQNAIAAVTKALPSN
jgi:hypothetical protein